MATVQLGKIKQVWRGTYNSSNTYAVDDLVAYTDSGITSTYIAIAASSSSNQQVPSTNGTATANYWEYVAKGVADPIPTQNSGTNGKFLKSDGTNLSFDTAGKILQIKKNTFIPGTVSGQGDTFHDVSAGNINITPVIIRILDRLTSKISFVSKFLISFSII